MTEYPANIVGESNYQNAIRRCRVGQEVKLVREHGNPHDDEAIAVVSSSGRTIGYLGRDSWVREAILQEGKGCAASISSIADGGSGHLGVVLLASLTDAELPARYYGQSLAANGKLLDSGVRAPAYAIQRFIKRLLR